MKVTLQQIGNNAQFEGTTATGQSINFHAPLKDGEEKVAPSPMEALLMAVASCTGVDVILILEKMKQEFTNFEVEVDGERTPKKSANPFSSIAMVYKFEGAVDQKKAERAVGLAVDKYCSVIESLNPEIEITWKVEVNS